MKYNNTRKAIFIERPNRFVAIVEMDGHRETVHVKNTGRCTELLHPGVDVYLEEGSNPSRKTKYDLISVYKPNLGWVNIDSQVPNKLVKEWIDSGKSVFGNPSYVKPEYTYGKSRVDFYLECEGRKILMEVKGCNQEIDGKGYFPDAPTERGVKHLYELAGAVDEGYECYIAFVITMPKVDHVYPNVKTHPEFGTALEYAVVKGVKILYLPCEVGPDELCIVK